MAYQWWHMPGPSRYISGTLDLLRDGRNVVLCLPEHLPGGMRAALTQDHPAPWHRRWRGLRLQSDSRTSPIDLLYRHCAPDARPSGVRRAAALVREHGFSRQMIWLEGLTPLTWPAWRMFLEEYGHACRDQLPDERTLFCVKLDGALALQPPTPDIGLVLARWDGVVTDIDMLLYTALVFPEQPLVGIKRRVAISVVASLALWDPTLCEHLIQQPLRSILQPDELLRQVARSRGWEPGELCGAWARGQLQVYGEQSRLHSAYLAVSGQHHEIERRIWGGQIAVLYPLLEERRRHLIQELADLLHVPFCTRDGALIQDMHDLELGHIAFQLAEHRRLGLLDQRLETTTPQVMRLKTLRDLLAHFQALRDDQLLI